MKGELDIALDIKNTDPAYWEMVFELLCKEIDKREIEEYGHICYKGDLICLKCGIEFLRKNTVGHCFCTKCYDKIRNKKRRDRTKLLI